MEGLNFIEALRRFFQNLLNKLVPKAFSVPISAWTASDDPEFPFTAEITADTVEALDLAKIDFDKSSIMAAASAVVITGETVAGKITLLAEKIPTMDLSGVYRIIKGGIE